MEGPSLLPTCFTNLLNNGDSYTKFQHHTTHKVTEKWKSMKRIIRISWEGRSLNHDKFCRVLLEYRNTPSRRDGLSPAQKLYGHPVQDILLAHHRSFLQQKAASVEQQEEQSFKTEHYYNQHAHALPEIQVGSNVAIHNSKTKLWDTYGVVTYVGLLRQDQKWQSFGEEPLFPMAAHPSFNPSEHLTPADLLCHSHRANISTTLVDKAKTST